MDTKSTSSSPIPSSTDERKRTTTTQSGTVSPSCLQCVKVLQELVSGLHILKDNKSSQTSTKNEPPPLTLLKAIAGGDSNKLRIENSEDGVTMHFPVGTTSPTLLKRWTKFLTENEKTNDLELTPQALATSVPRTVSPTEKTTPENPLRIELKCKTCSSTGPEGGARAFLMGPSPLSVVVCHNRIQSHPEELSEILTHELVHLYDVQTSKLDLQQCENLAYSEIRAAKAAECRNSWKQLQSFCVKQKAICATNNLFPSEGRKCVQKVFEKAFADNQPFEK